ncbi:cell wall-binding repeat-containing protein [Ornithinimicrobium ciconiae]|uniref:cell wall-binding repeat-containing protein n=1 Tax=Ornithinimicrobium ciconiae TaxID=2594265 RepID=UPI0013FD0294|nr:cell wall-binding repeat-containing protein [Ornithinimicrobium ciconiae]
MDSETGLWVVQLEAPSVAAKFGSSATSEASRYAAQLAAGHTELEQEISATLGRTVDATITYENVLNAIAIEADADEAAQLWDIDGVVAVFPDTIREMETDVSHEVIKTAAAWGGENAPEIATKGEGVIAAMIDSGVNPDHPSFAATGGDGYTHVNPNGAGVYLGACNTEASFECNDKLIGAYSFNGPTARDTDGHGSHTGSTMAGNAHTAEFTLGTADFEREISGVAPHANVISYKVCNPGCPSSATVQAVDQAIADGVDVINYSISGSDNPWMDMVDLAFLEAHDAGISVSASAGNDGPGASTVAKSGPWNLSVAATTHNRVFGNPVSVTDDGAPAELVDVPGFPGDGPAITSVYTGDLVDAAAAAPGNGNGCATFPTGSMTGDIALIQRGACNFQVKVDNAANAGAIAVVMYNNVSGPPTAPGGLTTTTIPSVMITLESGEALQAYAAANDPVEVSIGTDVVLVEDDTWTDLVAGFSSRGPSQFDMLVPTLAAPGVNILAAYSESGGDPLQYGVISGTSMASPHAAGMAVLMREVYPDLTPTEIRSVMASTADYEGLLKEDGSTPATAFDIGSGRINIDQAGRAGLALNETSENFVAGNPALGGDPATLNLPAFVEHGCEGECTWTRTVTSIAQGSASYSAVVDAPAGVTVTVTPETFTLEPGADQEITVTANVSGSTVGAWEHARVTLETSDQHADGVDIADPHFPVAVKTTSTEVPVDDPTIEVDPDALEATQPTDTVTTQPLTISNTGDADLTWEFVDETGGGGDGVLAEQTVNGTSGIVSDYFPNNGGGVYSADDFTLAADSSLTSLFTPGFWNADDVATRATAIDWEIFADDSGAPGELVWSHTAAPGNAEVTIETNEITLDLVAAGGAVDLSAGTYWLSVWPTVPDPVPNLNDRWNWYQGAPSGSPGMLIDPNFLFGPGTGDWTPIVDLVGSFSDLAYTIEGSSGTVSCGADWLSVDPSSGTTAPDGSTEVTASFDSAGLAEGDYSTQLCVESNDPANPVVTVPVTLTVAEAAVAPVITVDPSSVEGSQAPDTTTEHTVTIGNDGTADLDFEITEVEAATGEVERPELPQGTSRAHAATEAAGGPSAPAVVEPAAVPHVASLTEGFEDVEGLPAAGWAITNTSEPVGPTSWFQGNGVLVFPAHEGPEDSYAAANYNGTAEQGDISTWLMTPEVDLVNGSELSFYSRSTGEGYADRMEVRLSTSGDSTNVGTGYDSAGDFDTVLLTVNEDLAPYGYPAEWTEYTATIEGLDAPTTGRIAFRHHVPDGGLFGTASDFIGVDTVSYEAADAPPPVPACEVSDAAWLSVDPVAGTVAPGGSQEVTVGLDSAGLAVGEYTAALCVESNDPVNPVVNVPVTLTVTDAPVEPAVVQRISGENRYATAGEIAAEFPEGVDTVYIANGTEAADGADALAAGAAGAKGALEFIPDVTPEGDPAPILLVKNNQIPQATAGALAALDPAEIIIIGGTGSVSSGVEATLGESADVRRIAGADRYETAALIAAEYGSVETVYVATGQGDMDSGLALADALTAASLAGSEGSPVVLTRSGSLPAATAEVITELGVANIVVIGGTGAVSDDVLAQLNELAPTERVAGANRYETAVALTAGYGADADMLYIASGTNFPDALSGSSLTGSQSAPLLLTRQDHLPAAISEEILRLSPQGITIFGGTVAVNTDVEADLQALLDTTSTD